MHNDFIYSLLLPLLPQLTTLGDDSVIVAFKIALLGSYEIASCSAAFWVCWDQWMLVKRIKLFGCFEAE